MRVFLSVSLVFISLARSEITPTQDFDHAVNLDSGGNVKLWWSFNTTHVTFEIQAKTLGWIGLGFSPSGGMRNADMYVGWVSNGVPSITDRHGPSTGNGFPPMDQEQNIENLGGSEKDGWTRLKFRRKIVACDSDDISITESTMRVIYAYGTSDDFKQHELNNRGTKSQYILAHGSLGADQYPAGENRQSFDLLNDEFQIPESNTHYGCKLFKLPDNITAKQHVVTMEPVIQPGNEAFVHHFILYLCGDIENPPAVGYEADCTNELPAVFDQCTELMFAWAVGGTAFHFPHHVGFPIGETGSSKYFRMVTHYDNPGFQQGVADSSGVRIVYTSQHRPNEVGLISVGALVSRLSLVIPGQVDSFTDYGQCSSECLTYKFDEAKVQNITLISSLLHSHLLGRDIEFKHIRNGVELPPIAMDKGYDFNYQETKLLQKEIIVRPDDTLLVKCIYNSNDRNKTTFGGFGTDEEMCLVYSYYYPKIDLNFCITTPTTEALEDLWESYFGIENVSYPGGWNRKTSLYDVNVTAPDRLSGKSVGQAIDEFHWDEAKADTFSDQLFTLELFQSCQGLDRNVVNYTKISEVYVEPAPNCSEPGTTTISTQTTSAANLASTSVLNLFLGFVLHCLQTFCRL